MLVLWVLNSYIEQQVETRGLVWVSEDSEGAGIPFLRAFLPGGPLLDMPTPASQVHLKPLSSVGRSWHSTQLTAWEAVSHEAARQKQKQHELDWEAPSLKDPCFCVTTLLWCRAPTHGAPQGPWQSKALRMPSENQGLVQQEHFKTAIYNLSSFFFLFHPFLFLSFLSWKVRTEIVTQSVVSHIT